MIYTGAVGAYKWQTKPRFGVKPDMLHPLTQGMEAFYAFNEGAGSTASDLTFQNGPVTFQEPSVSWAINPGLSIQYLDGVNYGNTGVIFTTKQSPFSIAFRIYSSQASASNSQISLGNTAVTGQPLYVLSQSSTIFKVLLGDVTYRTLVSTVIANRWYTISSSYDSKKEYHYVDGKLVYSGSLSYGSVVVPLNLYVGRGFSGIAKGGAEWVAIWTRSLSDWEHTFIGRSTSAIWSIFKPQIDYSNLYQRILGGQISPSLARVLLGNSPLSLGQPLASTMTPLMRQ